MFRNKRLIAATVIAAIIAGIFWSQSRIPALNEKAQMGLRTNFGEIAFDIVLPVTAEQVLVERVLRSSVNWAYTNLQGMTFGLLFAAAVLTILSNLRRRQFDAPWQNSVTGVLIGAPLGVCVNCATPIAFGIYSAGARLETALTSLMASPTLNAIVITMAFTLLPWEIALAKVAGVVAMIAFVPVLVRRFAPAPDLEAAKAIASRGASRLPALETPTESPPGETVAVATWHVAGQFLSNLWYLVRFAVPLMLLAGVLGAAVVEIVPFDSFAGRAVGIAAIVAGGIVATILPVPIAFDVVLVMALLANGVDIGVATAVLFALGIYSIYPAAIIARYISPRLSIAIGVAVAIVAILLGTGMQVWFGEKNARQGAAIEAGLRSSGEALLTEAVGICSDLPERLQTSCIVRHIPDFDKTADVEQICAIRPTAMSAAVCTAAVDRYRQSRIAIDSLDTSACLSLADDAGRNQCIYSVILRVAQRDHDVGRCDALPDRNVARRCRAEYLNASLLFNPDNSACAGLAGAEQQDCQVNATIYRLADTHNIEACDTAVPEAARDHCRYTIASTMIGRQDDASGCARISDPDMAARCESLPTAWRAARQRSPALCEDLQADDLRDTCLLRVAERRIDAVLARSVLKPMPDVTSVPTTPDMRETLPWPDTRPLTWARIDNVRGAALSFSPHAQRQQQNAGFTRVDPERLGITRSWAFSVTDFFEPFIIGKGIASGDLNDDGWPDIALATERGVRLYQNIGGEFRALPLDQGPMAEANLFVVVLVDLNEDGHQDIFASAYGGTNYHLLNLDGEFRRTDLRIMSGDHRLTMAVGFGDLDGNGELDMVLGNWSSGLEKLFVPEQSANVLRMQRGGEFDAVVLDEVRGETNSILVADINADAKPDVLIGNDRLVPDIYYLGGGDGSLRMINVDEGIIPATTMFTMSIESADLNNDLQADIFSTDMTFARSSREDYCSAITDVEDNARCVRLLQTYGSLRNEGPDACDDISADVDRRDCFVAFSVQAARDLQVPQYCEQLPDHDSAVYSLCEYLARPAEPEDAIDQSRYLPQVQRNTLLLGDNGAFTERAVELGVSSSFWSWNAKAADIDNDEWQDIYVGNGFHFGENFYEIQDNILYRNLAGQGFEQVQAEWRLADPVNTPSYTYIDYDLDGDLDIIATGVLSGPRVYRNDLPTGHSLTFLLTDERGNRFAVGAKIVLRYGGEDARTQMREVTLSGGFLSFDGTSAHFGLGQYDAIDEIEVRWPDGEVSIFAGPLTADGIYRIDRQALR
jgi:uncharacterized membrane protein YraQ (UPF0718 family)